MKHVYRLCWSRFRQFLISENLRDTNPSLESSLIGTKKKKMTRCIFPPRTKKPWTLFYPSLIQANIFFFFEIRFNKRFNSNSTFEIFIIFDMTLKLTFRFVNNLVIDRSSLTIINYRFLFNYYFIMGGNIISFFSSDSFRVVESIFLSLKFLSSLNIRI